MDFIDITFTIPGWLITVVLAYPFVGLVLARVAAWLPSMGVRPAYAYVHWQHLWPGAGKPPLVAAPPLLVVACSMTAFFLVCDRRYLWQEARAARAVSPVSGA